MPEAVQLLNCPSCGASLPPPPAGQTFLQCPYCHNTVEVAGIGQVQGKAAVQDLQGGNRVNSAPVPASSLSGSSFRMTVEDIFSIKGRDPVATGRIQSGSLRVGDRVRITRSGGSSKIASVSGMEMFRKTLTEAKAGDNVGVFLKGVARNDLQRGDILEAA